MLLLRLPGLFLLRFAERTFLGLLFQEPPRIARLPALGPFPFIIVKRSGDFGITGGTWVYKERVTVDEANQRPLAGCGVV